ncbi:MAG: hypothetical protein C0404_14175 [Verrucomicrobia bacterium]|nr:hypothetical protein [Verrucomicrobiota bacterium]
MNKYRVGRVAGCRSLSVWVHGVAVVICCIAWAGPGTAMGAAVRPFFAPPRTTGSLTVTLQPTEGVSGTRLVTFGVPFPRGSVTPADLARVRVLKGGVEIPAHVEMLTPWRHVTNSTVDGLSVRVARIQVNAALSVAYPNGEDIVVDWGVSNRTQNIPSLTNPRSAWHLVTNGTFVAADNVYEPDVYAVLPKAHMCLGMFRTGMDPMSDTIPSARENPSVMDATEHWPGFLEADHASHNFFFSIINEDDPLVTTANRCPYKTDSEPWLYDRSSTMFVLYFRSGHWKALREAVRSSQFYLNQLYSDTQLPARAIGLFKLKVPDPNTWAGGNGAMYSYNECLAYNYWLTGDDAVAPAIRWVVTAHETNDEPTRWSPTTGTWTERHTAFRLLANVVGYEVFGDQQYKTNVQTQTADFIWHQNGANGQLPANRVDGGLYHYGSQHGDGEANSLVGSSWMTVLLVDAMVRAYSVTESAGVADFIRRVGTFQRAACKTDGNHVYDTYDAPLVYGDYMMRYDGVSDPLDGRDGTVVDHALETAAAVAWSKYFGDLLGMPDPSMKQLATNLYFTFDIGDNYWIRPGGPAAGYTAFRVSPWRKYGWEHRVSGSLSWAMAELPATVEIFGLTFAGGDMQFDFAVDGGSTGMTFRIERTARLGDTWTVDPSPVVDTLLTNQLYRVRFPVGGASSQFHRIRAIGQ